MAIKAKLDRAKVTALGHHTALFAAYFAATLRMFSSVSRTVHAVSPRAKEVKMFTEASILVGKCKSFPLRFRPQRPMTGGDRPIGRSPAVTTKPQYKRNLKNTLIEPFKQIKFGLYVLGLTVAFVGVCGYMFVEAFTEQYQHVMGIFNVVDPSLKWELVTNDVFRTNAIRIGILFAVFIATMLAMLFRLTHRYYGPLVSIERFVDQFSAGDYQKRCKIREKDELHGLVQKLNTMAEKIEQRHGAGTPETTDQKAG